MTAADKSDAIPAHVPIYTDASTVFRASYVSDRSLCLACCLMGNQCMHWSSSSTGSGSEYSWYVVGRCVQLAVPLCYRRSVVGLNIPFLSLADLNLNPLTLRIHNGRWNGKHILDLGRAEEACPLEVIIIIIIVNNTDVYGTDGSLTTGCCCHI